MGIFSDSQLLEPGNRISLFELDCTQINGDVLRFHGYNDVEIITWQGLTYTRWPIEADGFTITGEGQQPSPTLRVGNVEGTIGALVIHLNDLVGAKLTRRRTLVRYLDAANFPDGNPHADPEERFPDDVFYIEQKISHDKEVVEFSLRSALDLGDVFLPRRLIIQNVCSWVYRSADCGYTGTTFFTANDDPTADPGQDRCGKRVSSCKLRHPLSDESVVGIPFGGFPGVSLTGG